MASLNYNYHSRIHFANSLLFKSYSMKGLHNMPTRKDLFAHGNKILKRLSRFLYITDTIIKMANTAKVKRNTSSPSPVY